MPIADTFLPEFDQEMATTRALLERVPADRADWKPHPRSTALGQLAMHIANLPGFGATVISQTEVDMNPPGGAGYTPPVLTSTEELLATFDANVERTRAAIAGARDEELGVPWSLKSAGEVIFTLPRSGVLRTMMLNHVIHHRGQLSVYLRLRDVPLPPIYGPTADEQK